MYDILQLNDLLVPELHDIAERFSIPQMKKLSKPDLVSAILQNQADMNKETGNNENNNDAEKPKRKRIAKTEAEP